MQRILQLLWQLVGTDTGLSGRRLQVLAPDRFCHVLRRHIISRQTVRVQPDTHRVITATHDLHETDSINTFQLTQDINIRKVVDKLFRMGAVRTHDIEVHQHGVDLLFRNHTGPDHLLGQLVEDRRHTVLYVHRRHVGIGSNLKVDCCQRHTIVRTDGSHIGHARHTIDRPLERRGHRFRHHIGTGSGITSRHRHRRGYDIRELRNRQRVDRQRSQTDKDHRDYSRENRSFDK